ncbi:MAG: NADH:flavin oxidoreductase [Bacteroidota bacterium]
MDLNQPITFRNGKRMKNRFMLAPLTNKQSHPDGTLSEDEFNWLTMRAKGQFGLVMTCATSIDADGKCWSGQLGIHDDRHIAGHRRLVQKIQEYGSLAVVQLHHGGVRSSEEQTGKQPVGPSDNEEFKARAMSLKEVEFVRDQFIVGAKRAKEAGYDGVEIHGAHGYLLTQFLSSAMNHRSDRYGGSLENRARLIFEIVEGVREAVGPSMLVGIRLSPERFGMQTEEVTQVAQQLIDSGHIDFLDLSLWDVFKPLEGEGKTLTEYFLEHLDRKEVLVTVAGKIRGSQEVHDTLAVGVDFVTIGKSGILHHDFPSKVIEDEKFRPQPNPVSADYLREEGLGEAFVSYMQKWKGFVE